MPNNNTESADLFSDFMRAELGDEFQESSKPAAAPSAAPESMPAVEAAATPPVQKQQAQVSAPPVGQTGVATGETTTTTATPTPTGVQTTTQTTEQQGKRIASPSSQARMLGLETQDMKDRRKKVVEGLFSQGMLDEKTAQSVLGVPLDEKVTARSLGMIKDAPEAPTVAGGLKEVGKTLFEGAKNLFSGEIVGEAVASGLIRDFKLPEIRREQQSLQRKLLEKYPEQRDQIMNMKDPEAMLQFPDAAELIADSGLVLLDVLTLGKGKAVSQGVKTAAKQALKTGGKKGLATFIKKQLPAMLKTVGKEVRAGAGLGAGFGGLSEMKEGGDIGDTLVSAGAGALLGGAIPLASKALAGVGNKLFGNKIVKIGGGTHAELAMPKMTRKEVEQLAKEGNIKFNQAGEIVSVQLPERLKSAEKLLKSEGINAKDRGTAIKQITDKIEDAAVALKKELSTIKFNKQAVTGTENRSRKATQELSESPMFSEFSTSLKKGQDQFEKIVNEVKSKTTPTANDWWEVRKKYDKVVDARIKEYAGQDVNKAAALQEQWLNNRKILNEMLDVQAKDKALPTFKKMNQLYNARENIVTTLGTKQQKGWVERNKTLLKFIAGGTAATGAGRALLGD